MNLSKVPEWWRGTSVYHIYPRSYYDSNGDGIGDLPGIISKLDYIRDAGFETVWLSPFFRSPQQDFGYDISDYYSTAPEYGTAGDVERLIDEVHRRDMKILFDMVLNHTSIEHPWFIESSSSRENPKRDWYIWHDGRKGLGGRIKPPNNWTSQTGGAGWQYHEQTGQWFWAAFLPFQPDLNYRNPEVHEAVFKMLGYWLERGVDGFRLDIIGSLYEDEDFRNSPFILKLLPDEENDGMLFRSTSRTQNLPESIEFCRELRKFIDGYKQPERFLVGETFGPPAVIREFCRDGGLHTAFAFKCTEVPFTAAAFRELLTEYERCFAEPLVPSWAFTNHDRTRRISVLGSEAKAKLNAAFQITARGIPFFYYGEEVGMHDTDLKHRDSLDPVSFPFKKLPSAAFNFLNRKLHGGLNRDRVRTPMHWNASANAGFCAEEAVPWLPPGDDYPGVNAEKAAADENSILNCIRGFLELRKSSNALKFGILTLFDGEKTGLPPGVLAFRREYGNPDGETDIKDIFLNFSDKPVSFSAEGTGGRLLASTQAGSEACSEGRISLSAFEGIVLGS